MNYPVSVKSLVKAIHQQQDQIKQEFSIDDFLKTISI
jgi:hypothetical protein